MKKILIAFDGTQFSEGAFEFARQLYSLQPLLLTGVFIPQLSYANLWSYSTAVAGTAVIPMLEDDDMVAVQKNVTRFEDLCRQNKIAYTIQKDYFDFALPELKKETRFADLLILGSESFYNSILGEKPSDYLEEALHTAECPVVIVPEQFQFPNINIIAYDGSESSVYALKQFNYLFPELCDHETHIVYFGEGAQDGVPLESRLLALTKQHFTDLKITRLNKHPKDAFSNWLQEKNNAILVSGAYGRSFLSQMFKESFVHDIIAQHKLPIFIAHK